MPSSTPLKAERVAFGRRIRQARTAKEYSKAEAARLVGVKVQSWQQWERGLTSPRPEKIPKLASVLEVSANWLLGIPHSTQYAVTNEKLEEMLGNAARARTFIATHGARVEDSDRDDAALAALRKLNPELQHYIRGLIEAIAREVPERSAARERKKAG